MSFIIITICLTGDPAPILYNAQKNTGLEGPKPIQTPVPLRPGILNWSIKATFHLTISMRGQCATGKIQRNNYHHGSCGPSLIGKTMSVFLIFTQGTHRNVKNR